MNRAVTEAHIAAQAHLRRLVGEAIARSWHNLPGYDRKDVPRFVGQVVPVVKGAQQHSIALTNAFLARATQSKPVAVKPAAILAGTRNGVSLDEVYQRPFVTVWTALKAGTAWQDAVHAGLARAVGSGAMDVQLAMRDTLQAVGQANDTIMGYQRVEDGDACDFCQEVDGAQFRTDDPMPLHNNCGCGVEPIEYTRGRSSSFQPTPTPDGVAIDQHGELGPLLTSPADHFTSL